jgi:AbrB family looped-hinge helix DNA binding protein
MATATKVGHKYQVVIPKSIRDAAGLRVGDYVEARLTRDGILLCPKVLVDRNLDDAIKEGLADLEAGRRSKPFKSARALVRSLKRPVRNARSMD